MKKVIDKYGMVAFLSLVCAVVCGCSDGLKSVCEQADKDCPVLLDEDLGKITRVEMAEGTVEMTCLLSDDGDYEVEDIREYAEDRDDFRKNFVEAFVNCRQLTPLYEAMREQRAALKVIVKDDESPKYNVYFAAEEVQDFRDSKESIDADEYEDSSDGTGGRADSASAVIQIRQEVEKTKSMLPMKIEDGLSVQNASFDGDYVNFLSKADEAMFEIGVMRENLAQLKKAMLEYLKHDESSKEMLSLCVQAHVGIKYIYRGTTSGEECVVTLTPEDLNSITVSD